MANKRQLSPYEINQLRKYHIPLTDMDSVGETPVEYLTGHAEFCGHDFLVNKYTLIPRIETEEIVNQIIDKLPLPNQNSSFVIADIGTGSGCLGISTAIKMTQLDLKNITLYLSDISSDALDVAKKNAQALLPNSVELKLLTSDLLLNYPDNLKINLLLANLPYIPSQRISTLHSSVKDYEPHLALDGGSKGSELINRLLEEIPLHIGDSFSGIFEIDYVHQLSDFHIPHQLSSEIIKDSINHHNRFLIVSQSQR